MNLSKLQYVLNNKSRIIYIATSFITGIFIGFSSFDYMYPHWNQSDNTPSELNVCFTPNQNCESLIISTINRSQKRILVQAYAFTSEPIAKALIKCFKKGIEVKILYEAQQQSKNSQISKLKKSGIEMIEDKLKGIAHNKVIIVDDSYVITGSYNFTYAAQHMNAENVMLIINNNIVNHYIDNWESRYRKAKFLYP